MVSDPDPTPFPLDHLARRGRSDDVALVAGGETLSYADLDERVGRVADALIAHGLRVGDRVATWMGKTALACVMPLAAARAGLIHVPINPLLKRMQAAHILADSGARLLVANAARLETLTGEERGDAVAVALEDWRDGDTAVGLSGHLPDVLAALLYTSGSTGRPKGVMLSHANLWLGAISVAHYLGLSSPDRTLAVLPLAFDYGQNQLLSSWAAGASVISFDYLLANDVKKAIRRHDVTVLAGVPPLWQQLAALDWSDGAGGSLRTLTNSGGHLPEPVVRRLRALFPNANLHLMYGLTEAFRSASLNPALVDAHPDSVGVSIPFAELMIVRPDGSEAEPGQEGELVHAGPLVAHGYWRDAAKTAERYRPAPSFSRYGGTAVWSGDTMVKGTDGLLRFRGRDDAMIKVSGNRLSPNEIEELAMASDAVREVAAFGISDEALGQVVALAAVAATDDAEDRLRAWFAANAPAFMMPRRILWRDALPTGATGKLDRVALKALLS
ncbi:AMP-binding protein [Sphingomonas rhizophila]|uniref:AMP-binding protein n=1 Tax=Sphingomonas rhizophila TaxID=2071607 RepID=A0A7G9SEB9_9SPHN|nr:AMP-binding protein [Sphingomonas rhizophila]QNN66194.1 AMP-binding protein [Sphingomonas rhizophila]